MSIFDMSRAEFFEALEKKTTPELLWRNAPNIYNYFAELFHEVAMDSLLREWAFEWYSEKTHQDYDLIYNHWLGLPYKPKNNYILKDNQTIEIKIENKGTLFVSSNSDGVCVDIYAPNQDDPVLSSYVLNNEFEV